MRAPINPRNLTGAASLIVWSLLLVVSVKYLFVILKLDNRGEGGILALSALIRGAVKRLGGKDSQQNPAVRPGGRGLDLCGRHAHSGDLRAQRGGGPVGERADACPTGRCRSRWSF